VPSSSSRSHTDTRYWLVQTALSALLAELERKEEALERIGDLTEDDGLRLAQEIAADALAALLADLQRLEGIVSASANSLERKRVQVQRLEEALRQIAENGGWVTTWHVDEAEPEAGKQPTISNRAQEIALAALREAKP